MRYLFVLFFGLSLKACSPEAPVPLEGPWRAVLHVPGGELPVEFLIEDGQAYFTNDVERVAVQEVRATADSVHWALPAFGTTIGVARRGAKLDGAVTLIKEEGKPQVIPFHATAAQTTRFLGEGAPPVGDISGRWAVTFIEHQAGDTTHAVGEFEQNGSYLSGTFMTSTGDYRYLEGVARADSLFLSTFDGAHAFLFKAAQQADGTLTGGFWSGTHWYESWTAYRDTDAALPDPLGLASVKGQTLSFQFPDADGRLLGLDDARFEGKVTLVVLSGSWCPNCHDKAAFLANYYHAYRKRGLEVIGLMYEHYPELEDAAEQVRHFAAKHDIAYPLLIAGVSDKEEAGETLPELSRVVAYPTTIFVDKQGVVRRVHSGFAGPGTGAHHDAYVAEFTAFTEVLLAEE
ncbi:MAG: hypothetical protein RhofKO_37640 [Rhodothermales bacterium]